MEQLAPDLPLRVSVVVADTESSLRRRGLAHQAGYFLPRPRPPPTFLLDPQVRWRIDAEGTAWVRIRGCKEDAARIVGHGLPEDEHGRVELTKLDLEKLDAESPTCLGVFLHHPPSVEHAEDFQR